MAKARESNLPRGFKRPDFAPVWKPKKKGDTLTGILQRARTVRTKNGPQIIYSIVTDHGAMDIWHSAGLRDLGNVGVGQEVFIRYDGDKDVGQKQPLRLYSVGVKE